MHRFVRNVLLASSMTAIAAFAVLQAGEPPVKPTPDKGGEAASETFSADQKAHWSYQPLGRPEPPPFANRAGSATRSTGSSWPSWRPPSCRHAPEADRVALIRRVTFDLTGLPPTPEEVAAFLADPRPDAYERLVDRLLESPHYGERWAQHWLDLAHYADSNGFELDAERPDAWRYRDWVVEALNADMPYDRFLSLQLAGDEVEPGDRDALDRHGLRPVRPARGRRRQRRSRRSSGRTS